MARCARLRANGLRRTLPPEATASCPSPLQVYCASKHAVHAFMKALRYETYAKNVRATVVAPGFVGEGTEFSEVRFKGDADKAKSVYTGMKELKVAAPRSPPAAPDYRATPRLSEEAGGAAQATDVAAQIVWALRQPAHVNLDMIHVMPTCQGGATRIFRDHESYPLT